MKKKKSFYMGDCLNKTISNNYQILLEASVSFPLRNLWQPSNVFVLTALIFRPGEGGKSLAISDDWSSTGGNWVFFFLEF